MIVVDDTNKPLFERAQDALSGSMNIIVIVFQWIVVVISAAIPVLLIGGVVFGIVWAFRRRSKGKTPNE
ncbi:hypothetical protein D3C76_1755510 [compost metagenome]